MSSVVDFPVPRTLRTARLRLRPWTAADAPLLLPVLQANVAHLGPWIPPHVATPVPLPALAERLAGFEADFTASRAWRYALLPLHDTRVYGEVDLFPRAATGRVPYAAADRAEIGYWLDAAVTGQGLALEAAGAMLAVAQALPALRHVEIRCDAANVASARVPQRLGFQLAAVEAGLQVWRKPLSSVAEAGT
jgi:RimJ/RimL family protein N-acetyltransferase